MIESLEGRRLMAVGSVTSVSLIDAAADRVVGVVQNGATLDLATLPSRSLSFRADVTGTVQSVRLAYDGTARTRTENVAPYALLGDTNGNYNGFTPSVGDHTIAATPYEFDSAGGARGTTRTVTFNVIDSGIGPQPLPSPTPAPSTGAFRESNGVVVMEAESLPTPTGWSRRNSIAGYTGSGYIQSNVSKSLGGTGTITFKFVISKAGNYEFRFRNRIASGTSHTDHNDSFVRFPTGKNVAGEWALSGWTKAYTNQFGAWSWQTTTKDHDPRRIRQYFSAGEHSVQISVRSAGHAIDRLVLYKYDTVAYNSTTFNNLPESARV